MPSNNYYQKNKEQILERCKQYYLDNKEKIDLYQKEYRAKNLDKVKEKDRIKAKKYRENNPEKVKEKMTCECGSTFVKYQKQRHLRTKKHLDFIESKT